VSPEFLGFRGVSRAYGLGEIFRARGCGEIHLDLRFKPDHVVLESMIEIESRFVNQLSTIDASARPGGRTVLRFSWSDRDRRTIAASAFVLRSLARRLGDTGALLRPIETLWYHPSGTCRMSSRDTAGVVDGDCRVHGTRNLFIAGSAVFPTPGSGNPTLTLIALALRLGDHLSARFRSS
jgi:choline dehydrogenase-like flavoprotein